MSRSSSLLMMRSASEARAKARKMLSRGSRHGGFRSEGLTSGTTKTLKLVSTKIMKSRRISAFNVPVEFRASQNTPQLGDCFETCTDNILVKRSSQYTIRNRTGSKCSADKSAVVDYDPQLHRSSWTRRLTSSSVSSAAAGIRCLSALARQAS